MPEAPTRVPLSELIALITLGEPLPFRVLDGSGRLLLAAGHVLRGEDQVQALIDRQACVDGEEAAPVRRARAGSAPAAPAAVVRELNWFDHWERRVWSLDALLRDLGRSAECSARLWGCVDEHIAMVERQPDAALFTAVRQDDARVALYPLRHALHCATVALLAVRRLGWPDERQRSLVGAALTMNTPLLELQSRMAEQVDPPSKKQFEQIRAHPAAAAAQLRAGGIDDADWLAAVEDHHERSDGSGYPRGSTEIGEAARLLRAADQFTAKISPRAVRVALSPQLAARQLFQEEAGGTMAMALIQAVGIYPPGDFVTLKNGEAGVVARRASVTGAAEVAVLMSAAGKPVGGAPRRDTAQPELGIVGPLKDRTGWPRVLPEQIYGLLPG
jgi:HD-GYP domain-containing protein (c-di-GMP phosphodiesterase class II)